jgi:hypothetical protein
MGQRNATSSVGPTALTSDGSSATSSHAELPDAARTVIDGIGPPAIGSLNRSRMLSPHAVTARTAGSEPTRKREASVPGVPCIPTLGWRSTFIAPSLITTAYQRSGRRADGDHGQRRRDHISDLVASQESVVVVPAREAAAATHWRSHNRRYEKPKPFGFLTPSSGCRRSTSSPSTCDARV